MRFKLISQINKFDCGASCISMLLNYYGSSVSVAECRKLSGTSKNGTTIYGLVSALESQNMLVKPVASDNREKMFSSGITMPAIVNVVNSENVRHYVVLYNIKNDKVWIADPDKGLVVYTLDELRKICTGIIILAKPKKDFIVQKKKKVSPQREFLELLFSDKSALISLLIISLFLSAASISFIYFIQLFLDKIASNLFYKDFFAIAGIMLAIVAAQGLCTYIKGKLLIKVSSSLSVDLMSKYFSHIMRLPLDFFGNMDSGEIITRFGDINFIQSSVTQMASGAILDILSVIAVSVIMYLLNPKMLLVCVISVLLYLPIAVYFQKRYSLLSKDVLVKDAALNSQLYQMVNNVETVKSLSVENSVTEKVDKVIDNLVSSNKVLNASQYKHSSIHIIIHGLTLMVAQSLGAFGVMSNTMTFATFIVGYMLMSYFTDPVERLINLLPAYQKSQNSLMRLRDILEIAPERTDGKDELSFKNELTLKNIGFQYLKGKNIINNIDITISKGQRTLIIGDSGSGKTTFALILAGLYEPTEGYCLIDNVPYSEYTINAIRRKILYISQNTSLFSGSIIKNLLISNPEASEEQIINACKAACIYDFIMSLPGRFEMFLYESGRNLSQGQRQRLCIARALLTMPEVIIIDEATNCLDSVTERDLFKGIKSFYSSITILVISHKINLINDDDNIFLLENGTLTAEGKHSSLIKNNKKYKGYYDLHTIN